MGLGWTASPSSRSGRGSPRKGSPYASRPVRRSLPNAPGSSLLYPHTHPLSPHLSPVPSPFLPLSLIVCTHVSCLSFSSSLFLCPLSFFSFWPTSIVPLSLRPPSPPRGPETPQSSGGADPATAGGWGAGTPLLLCPGSVFGCRSLCAVHVPEVSSGNREVPP